MTELLQFAGTHPVLTCALALIVGATIVGVFGDHQRDVER